ncbi:hypothetical protein GCM10023339_19390 [Alloalcanivorax gelatiniphagus]
MSDLVAVEPIDIAGSTYEQVAEGDYSGLVGFYPGASDAVAAGQAFAEGDALSGVIALAGVATDTVMTVIDPFATLLSSVAGFLMDYVPPLPQMLDSLAGNPALVESIGVTWGNIADHLETGASNLMNAVNQAMSGWAGLAASAFAAVATALVDAMNKSAYVCRCIAQGMQLASGVVQAVRTFVRDLIADLVGALIAWAGEVAATVGIGASWVIPKATARISITVTDCTTFTQALVRGMTDFKIIAELVDTGWGTLLNAIKAVDGGIDRGGAGA